MKVIWLVVIPLFFWSVSGLMIFSIPHSHIATLCVDAAGSKILGLVCVEEQSDPVLVGIATLFFLLGMVSCLDVLYSVIYYDTVEVKYKRGK